MITVVAVQPLLGQDPDPPAQGPEFGGSSPIGLVVTLLMLVALIFLVRSMNKHLRKVPPSFEPEPEQREPAESAESAGSPVPGARPSPEQGARPSPGSPTDGSPPS
ncbi:MAG TPA: hypothetical protein VK735_07565 [Pseudonocardia sp.]|uniref:hypothetical protein n=1 Tax=Pseudonocardia sp. TaxID=60912 RepID=UPI002CFB117F|nr:hypothetical protein [Pseudonocardia sp.]HTF47289.1 hypothetical protein [Pseudonocardia sp.]